MIELAIVGVLTFIVIGCIFLAALVRLWKNPPVININVTVPDFSIPIIVPDQFNLTTQRILSSQETDKPSQDEILPPDIFVYCEQESDEWARNARKAKVRALKRELGSWDAAFRMLQMEDSIDE